MAPPPFPESLRRRYQPAEVLGAGSMGVVYRAHDRELDRPVAIKLLLAPGEDLERRFLREAACLARVDHPNVVRCFDHGRVPEGPYLAMEFLEGETLRETRAELEPLAAMLAVADALEAVHAAGILHRDLKPDNAMRTSDGRVLLVDFGLAKDPRRTRITREGMQVGSFAYLAPEQLRGVGQSQRTDWYAWGVSLYFLIEGKLPYRADQLLASTQGTPLPPPSFEKVKAGSVEEAVLQAALAPDAEERIASRAELEEVILERTSPRRRVGTASVGKPLAGTVPSAPIASQPRGHWGRPLGLAAMMVALLAGGVWFTSGRSSPPPLPPSGEPTPSLPEDLIRAGRRLMREHRDPEGRVRPALAGELAENHLGVVARDFHDVRAPIRYRRWLEAVVRWFRSVRARGPTAHRDPAVVRQFETEISPMLGHVSVDLMLIRENTRGAMLDMMTGLEGRRPRPPSLPPNGELRLRWLEVRRMIGEVLDTLPPEEEDEGTPMIFLRSVLLSMTTRREVTRTARNLRRAWREETEPRWRFEMGSYLLNLIPDVVEGNDMECGLRDEIVMEVGRHAGSPLESIHPPDRVHLRGGAMLLWFASRFACPEDIDRARLEVLERLVGQLEETWREAPASVDLMAGWTLDNFRSSLFGRDWPAEVVALARRVEVLQAEVLEHMQVRSPGE